MKTRNSNVKKKRDDAKNKRLRSAMAQVPRQPARGVAKGSSKRKKKCAVDVAAFLKTAEKEDRAVGGSTMVISCQVPSYRRAQSAIQDRFVDDLTEHYGEFKCFFEKHDI